MDIRDLLVIVAASLNFFGALFFFLGTFRLTNELIANLTGSSYPVFTVERLKSLTRKQGLIIAAISLVVLSLGFLALPLVLIREPWQILTGYDKIALAAAASVAVSLLLIVLKLSLSVARRIEEEAKRSVMKNRLGRALAQNPLGPAHWGTVVESAETLVGISRRRNEPIKLFLQRLATELNVSLPKNLQIEE